MSLVSNSVSSLMFLKVSDGRECASIAMRYAFSNEETARVIEFIKRSHPLAVCRCVIASERRHACVGTIDYTSGFAFIFLFN